jgi:LuxR family maltose regulon positive regulatory protein
VVGRPQLTGRLNAALASSLTLVSAPAGFGKTTLLVEWLATLPEEAVSIGWLSIDDRDNDPVLFWSYVIAAMRASVDSVGGQALQLLSSSTAASPPEVALGALINDLNRLSKDMVLVLDDYHLVEATPVHDGMSFLLMHQPPQLHVVLATRVDPPLPLARMRAGGQLAEVRAADLRFSTEEATTYLNGSMSLALDRGDVLALDHRTEGWIAALQLAALSLHGRDDVSAFIAGFTGDDRYIVDYLVEEVLSRQPNDVQDFLLRTSILERLTGPLCDAVTGRKDGRQSLIALERANLFLVPLDDRRQWYRYHHLFAEVLQAHLVEEQPGNVAELHRRASAWFEAHGDTSEAISHALAGRDPGRAAHLMELAMPVMSRDRREAELAGWVRSLPNEVLGVRPVLGVAFVGVLAQASQFETIRQRLDDIDRALRPHGGPWPKQPPAGMVIVDEPGYQSLPARVSMYRAALALAQADLDGTIEHSQEALTLAPPDDGLTRASAGALAGLASWTRGDLQVAHEAYTQTVAGLGRLGFVADVLGCCIALGDIRRVQGRLEDALSTYHWALAMAAGEPEVVPVRGMADMHVGIAGVLLERNDLAAAVEHLAASRDLGEQNGLPQHPYRWRVTTARLRETQGDLDGALDLLDEAGRFYVGDYSPNVQPVPAVRARLWLRRGERGRAELWAREQQLSAGDELTYLREYEHLTLARVLLARHRDERDYTALREASALLQRLLAAAEAGGRGGSLIEALVLQALAHQATADEPAALGALRRAVVLAQPEGYVRIFADEGPPMAALLKALAKRGDATGYVRRLLASAHTHHQSGAGISPELTPPLSERELQVLRLLATDLPGPDIARELFVSLNTLRTHSRNIYLKLGVASRRAAVHRAHDLNLLPDQHRR